MTYLDAALAVLEKHRRPMSAKEIVDTAAAAGLLDPTSKTPTASRTARLYCYVRDASSPLIERHFRPGDGRARRGVC
jgi:hypothetical protein